MLGFSRKLPISENERLWVDEGFTRLEKLLGRSRMLEARVALPNGEHFPDIYDKTPGAAEALFQRMCEGLRVDSREIEFEIFPDEAEDLREILPFWSDKGGGCAAGMYTRNPESPGGGENIGTAQRRMVVSVRSSILKDQFALVATIAHELGHVILLGGGLMDPRTPDHEPMTDLLTVYLGYGIFTANSAARFSQFQDGRRQGWSMQRMGYLGEEIYGYALAKFAAERHESRPVWLPNLSTNVRVYYKRSRVWLARNSAGGDFRSQPSS